MGSQFLLLVFFASSCSSLLLQGITSAPMTSTPQLTDKHYTFLLDLLAEEKLLRHQLERSVIKQQEDIRNITELLEKAKLASCRTQVNVALGKPAMMSSNLGSGLTADKAFDGRLETFAHSEHTNLPWLLVDLQQTYSVKKIVVYNRVDCCGDRLRALDVSVGATTSNLSLCGHFAGPGTNGQEITFNCPTAIKGRYVKLLIQDPDDYINIAEVAVYE